MTNALDVPHSRTKIAVASVVAAAIAALILIVAVLPAEYGIDPLGTGRALGLLNLAATNAAPPTIVARPGGPISPRSSPYKVDAIEFALIPTGSVEYKYHLDQGATMLYSWKASAPVVFDMHTEPAGKPKEASDSFEAGQADQGHGSYTAPYAGIHGWYWQNTTDAPVTIRLTSAGFYTAAKMFDETGASTDMPVTDPPPPATP